MERKIEDVEKSMKRSNDKQLKIELECCQRVRFYLLRIYMIYFIPPMMKWLSLVLYILYCI